jgi:hypothetical protein
VNLKRSIEEDFRNGKISRKVLQQYSFGIWIEIRMEMFI